MSKQKAKMAPALEKGAGSGKISDFFSKVPPKATPAKAPLWATIGSTEKTPVGTVRRAEVGLYPPTKAKSEIDLDIDWMDDIADLADVGNKPNATRTQGLSSARSPSPIMDTPAKKGNPFAVKRPVPSSAQTLSHQSNLAKAQSYATKTTERSGTAPRPFPQPHSMPPHAHTVTKRVNPPPVVGSVRSDQKENELPVHINKKPKIETDNGSSHETTNNKAPNCNTNHAAFPNKVSGSQPSSQSQKPFGSQSSILTDEDDMFLASLMGDLLDGSEPIELKHVSSSLKQDPPKHTTHVSSGKNPKDDSRDIVFGREPFASKKPDEVPTVTASHSSRKPLAETPTANHVHPPPVTVTITAQPSDPIGSKSSVRVPAPHGGLSLLDTLEGRNQSNRTRTASEEMVENALSGVDFEKFFDDDDMDDSLLRKKPTNHKPAPPKPKGPHVLDARRTAGVTSPVTLLPEIIKKPNPAVPKKATDPVSTNSGTASNAAVGEGKGYGRYLVLEVSKGVYMPQRQAGGAGSKHLQREVTLRLFDETNGLERFAVLRDNWTEVRVALGDTVHVIGQFDEDTNTCIVDDNMNLLIANPDTLVSGTRVGDSFQCLRRAVLSERAKGMANSLVLLLGTLLHEVFDAAVALNNFSSEHLTATIDGVVTANIEAIFAVGIDEKTTRKKLGDYVPAIQGWAGKFLHEMPHAEGVVEFDNTDRYTVLDLEENFWTPAYGLKGKVDATVAIRVYRGGQSATAALGTANPNTPFERRAKGLKDDDVESLVMPLELKTGRVPRGNGTVAHRAQVILYTMMMGDRYGIDVANGLLYYMKNGSMYGIAATRDDIRGLIIARNELAYYLADDKRLPEMVKDPHMCQGCFQLDACALMHAAVENGTDETSGYGGTTFDDKTGHLTQSHRQFLAHWLELISLEASNLSRYRKEIWCLPGWEREKLGRCMSHMQVAQEREAAHKGGQGKKHVVVFERSPAHPIFKDDVQAKASLVDLSFQEGDMVVISSMFGGDCALATAFLVDLTPSHATVTIDRPLRIPFRINTNDIRTVEYRIDATEYSSGMGAVRDNLLKMFTAGNEQVVRLRSLLVDMEPPAFDWQVDGQARRWEKDLESLNEDQRQAIKTALAAQDYALILGMPGTGKTTAIAHLVQQLVRRGKSVLLTSYMHTAVDNILLKLADMGVDFVRLGRADKVHPTLQKYTPPLGDNLGPGRKQIKTVSALKTYYESKAVVATTCLGVNHALFGMRTFDVCIVDEASQITLPLPPIVQNAEAREKGLQDSLFKMLSEAHPQSVVSLSQQYRMNRDIMLLSNDLIYAHRLTCGTDAIAASSLVLPSNDLLRKWAREVCKGHEDTNWVYELCRPQRRVVFADTDGVPALEGRQGDGVRNEGEAQVVAMTVSALMLGGVTAADIGVISPYRAQVALIRHHLTQLHPTLYGAVEVHTVDKYQGRDKQVMLVSLVRSNPQAQVGDLLRDWRRVNVAFTRAKQKLIVIGSRTTLRGSKLFDRFLSLVEDHDWVYRLPAKATTLFPAPDLANVLQNPRPITKKRQSLYGDEEPVEIEDDGTGQCGLVNGQQRKLAKIFQRPLSHKHMPIAKNIEDDLL